LLRHHRKRGTGAFLLPLLHLVFPKGEKGRGGKKTAAKSILKSLVGEGSGGGSSLPSNGDRRQGRVGGKRAVFCPLGLPAVEKERGGRGKCRGTVPLLVILSGLELEKKKKRRGRKRKGGKRGGPNGHLVVNLKENLNPSALGCSETGKIRALLSPPLL